MPHGGQELKSYSRHAYGFGTQRTLAYILGYLDDVLVTSETFCDHLLILDKVLSSIEYAHLKRCPGKCLFARREAKSLGHAPIITGFGGSQMEPNWPNLAKFGQI